MNSCKITYIYGLYEVGKENEIRYVGKTNNPKSRIHSHKHSTIKNSKSRNHLTHKERWILKILNQGGNIGIKILEECNSQNWSEREILWISSYSNLTNLSPGGETGITGKTFEISYEDCKKWIKDNFPNIKSKKDWHKNSNFFPGYIPKSPNTVFVDSWISWGDFLDSGYVSSREKNKKYLNYEECKIWLKFNIDSELKLSWRQISKNLPFFIPKKPTEHFKSVWQGWNDFLGYDVKQNFVSYEECLNFVRSLKLGSSKEWIEYFNNHKDIQKKYPRNINKVYKDNFISWTDFLNSSKKSVDIRRELMNFDDLKKYVRKNLYFITSSRQWKYYLRLNNLNGIPKNPQISYKDKGWSGWKEFLNKN